jgi:hypothetical protein
MNGKIDIMIKVVRDLGFPIFVAGYLLLQMAAIGPKVDAMATSLVQINDTLRRLEQRWR